MNESIIKGNECPKCQEELVLEGEFYSGQEVECSCGWTFDLRIVETIVKIELRPLGKNSKCVCCGEMRADPEEFYDGLRCRECADREMREQDRRETLGERA